MRSARNLLRAPAPALALLALLPLLLVSLAAPHPVAAAETVLTPYDVARLESVREVAISPDGRHTAYLLQVPRTPFEDEDGPAWSELHVVGPEGESRPYVTGTVDVGSISWTPDGREILFLAQRGDDEHTALWSIPLAGGEARRALSHDEPIASYSLSPDGRHVAFVAGESENEELAELREEGFDVVVFEEQDRPRGLWIAPLGEDSRPEAESHDLEDGGDPTEGEPGDEGDGPRRLGIDGSVVGVEWSPAGDRLAVSVSPSPRVDDVLMETRVRIVAADDGRVLGRVDNPGKLGQLAWSPDGRHLALIAGEELHDPREGRLMVVPADGGPMRELLPDLEAHVTSIAWRDSERLLAIVEEGVWARIEQVGADGTGRSVLVEAGPIWGGLSAAADGSALAVVADTPEHPAEAFRLELDGAGGNATPRRLTDSNPWLADFRLAPQEVVRFEARDGLEIEGILIRPLDAAEGERHPLILYVHGGPESHHSNGWLTTYSAPGQVAAADGYAVFHTNYRGSTGRGVEFSKMGQGKPAGAEFDDLIDAVDHLIETGLVDRDKVGVTGGSYGGYATAWLSTAKSDRFAAGVMFVGISELIAKHLTSDIPNELYLVHERVWPWEDWELMLERSPLYHVENAKTPLLIAHGDSDTRVHPSQSLILYRALKTVGEVPVRLVWYPGEPHGNRRAASRLDYSLRQLRWFDHYLKGPGGDPPPPRIDYEVPEDEAPEVETVEDLG